MKAIDLFRAMATGQKIKVPILMEGGIVMPNVFIKTMEREDGSGLCWNLTIQFPQHTETWPQFIRCDSIE